MRGEKPNKGEASSRVRKTEGEEKKRESLWKVTSVEVI